TGAGAASVVGVSGAEVALLATRDEAVAAGDQDAGAVATHARAALLVEIAEPGLERCWRPALCARGEGRERHRQGELHGHASSCIANSAPSQASRRLLQASPSQSRLIAALSMR